MNTAIIHAWSVTDIDVLVQESSYSTFSATNFTPRLALSFRSIDGLAGDDDTGRNILDAALLVLPLSNLDTLLVQRFKVPPEKSFWLRHVPKWPFLRRVKLEVPAYDGFRMMLLEGNNGERPLLPLLTEVPAYDGFRMMLLEGNNGERPLLPLLTELVLKSDMGRGSTEDWIPALKKRTEQGVPLKRLDLRMCSSWNGVPLLR